MQDPATFPEVKMDFPIAAGPMSLPGTPSPKTIRRPRMAARGQVRHLGPLRSPGRRPKRRLVRAQNLSARNAGLRQPHPRLRPSLGYGYKDVLRTWNPTKLNPAKLVKIYRDAGARFLIVQGVHHDNFDNWNSTYQPWNSVNMGPKRDLIGEWSKARTPPECVTAWPSITSTPGGGISPPLGRTPQAPKPRAL